MTLTCHDIDPSGAPHGAVSESFADALASRRIAAIRKSMAPGGSDVDPRGVRDWVGHEFAQVCLDTVDAGPTALQEAA
jgi:hypothetical protein